MWVGVLWPEQDEASATGVRWVSPPGAKWMEQRSEEDRIGGGGLVSPLGVSMSYCCYSSIIIIHA